MLFSRHLLSYILFINMFRLVGQSNNVQHDVNIQLLLSLFRGRYIVYYYNHTTSVVADISELYTHILYYIILHPENELINNTALLQVLQSKDQHAEREAGICRTLGCFLCLEKYETTFCLFIIYINHKFWQKLL